MFLFKSYLVYFQKVFAALRQVGGFMQKKKKKKKKKKKRPINIFIRLILDKNRLFTSLLGILF